MDLGTNEANAQPLLTAEQFLERYGEDRNLELVRGRVSEIPPANPTHGKIDANLILFLKAFVRERGSGEVYLNTGFVLRRNPDTIRGPDEAFVSKERIARHLTPWRVLGRRRWAAAMRQGAPA